MTVASRAIVPKAVVSSTDEYHDPVWLVRRAWSSLRLVRLQAVIRKAIAELQGLAPRDLLGKDWTSPELSTRLPDPVIEALRACSEELRDASGMAGSQVAREAHCTLVRRYISQQPAAWEEAFSAALEQYRRAACRVLLAAFPREPQPESIAT